MTKYHAVMLDETGCEFDAFVEADTRDEAYDTLLDYYPESGCVQLSPDDTEERERLMRMRLDALTRKAELIEARYPVEAQVSGATAAANNEPRVCPSHLTVAFRREWYKGYDNEMAGQRLDRGIREEPLLD